MFPDFSPALNTLRGMALDFSRRAPYFLVALLVFGAAYLLSHRVRRLLLVGASRANRGANFSALMARLGGGAVLLGGALVAAPVAFPAFTPATLLSTLGFVGVAAGFALRDILGNLFCGLVILASEPFRIGDRIALKGFEGEVEDVQTRATFIRTRDGRRIVVPNTLVFGEPVEVVTAFSKRRLETTIPLSSDDWEGFKARALTAMNGLEGIETEPPPTVFCCEWKETGAVLGLRWWIQSHSAELESRSRDAVLMAVARAVKPN